MSQHEKDTFVLNVLSTEPAVKAWMENIDSVFFSSEGAADMKDRAVPE